MSAAMDTQTMGRYVQVLEQRAQQAQHVAVQAQQQLQRSQQQVLRLQNLAASAQLKKSARNVALYANAAGFRSGVLEMAAQCRDACNVQEIEWAQAQQAMQGAMRRHSSMQEVLAQAQHSAAQLQARQAQKTMDDMAVQAWLRNRPSAPVTTETVHSTSSEVGNDY